MLPDCRTEIEIEQFGGKEVARIVSKSKIGFLMEWIHVSL